MKNSRGQVLPLWVVAILSTFVLMFMALNYGNTIRWQVRAQSAADAAALALTSIQTERYNMMLETLYASNVEEFRLRRLLDSTLMAANFSGGCSQPTVCEADYTALTAAYVRSVSRYTYDIQVLNDVTQFATATNWSNDAAQLLTHIQTAGTCNDPTVVRSSSEVIPDGGDCAFKYTMFTPTPAYRTGLNPVEFDAIGNCIPGLGRACNANEADSEHADFAPIQVEVVACAKVPPLIPAFGALQTQPYYAVGRAAATSVMVEEDWFQPGALYFNLRPGNTPFQGGENYGTAAPATLLTGYHWYDVNFGGNGAQAYPTYGVFTAPNLSKDDLSVRMGWWNAVQIKPFTPAASINLTTMCN